MEQKTVKEFRHVGGSAPGLFEGTRWSSGRGRTVEHTELVQHRGILYITNQRIVFQATEWGFDKTYRYLTAITPYSNACELQFGIRSLGVLLLILGILGIAAAVFRLGPLILLAGLLFLPLGIVCIGVSRAWEAAEESQPGPVAFCGNRGSTIQARGTRRTTTELPFQHTPKAGRWKSTGRLFLYSHPSCARREKSSRRSRYSCLYS